jgi:hypothetical protein
MRDEELMQHYARQLAQNTDLTMDAALTFIRMVVSDVATNNASGIFDMLEAFYVRGYRDGQIVEHGE